MVKAKYVLVFLSIAALALFGVGCNKATGGGWFINDLSDNDNKITFGFNAQPTGKHTVKGKFQLIDHGSKTKIHGTFSDGVFEDDPTPTRSRFWGPCSINGEDGYEVFVWVEDNGEPGVQGDEIYIEIYFDDELVDSYHGILEGGNIQVHESKEK